MVATYNFGSVYVGTLYHPVFANVLHNIEQPVPTFVSLLSTYEPRHEYFQQCGMCDKQRLRPSSAYAQSDQSLCLSLGYSTNVKLLTE